MPIWDACLQNRCKAAAVQYQIKEIELRQEINKVIHMTRTSYFDILHRQEELKLHEKIVQFHEEMLNQIKIGYEKETKLNLILFK